MTQANTQLFGAVASLVEQIDTEKTAHTKTAEPTPSDPGGYQGPSSHPSTKVENRVENATEGSRSSENVADNKADQGAPGVDSTSDVPTGAGEGTPEQDKKQLNIGTNQSSTGADPTAEDDYKDTKDDAGYDADTSHPTKADKDREKYSSASFKEASDKTIGLAESILSQIAINPNGVKAALSDANTSPGPAQDVSSDPKSEPDAKHSPKAKGGTDGGDKEAAADPAAQPAPLADKIAAAQGAIDQAPVDPKERFNAGYELAGDLGMNQKQASDAVGNLFAQTIKEARTAADLVAGYVGQKVAMALPGGEEPVGPASEGEGEGGEMPPQMGQEPAPAGGGGIEALLGGGAPPEGGDPMMGGGEDPMMGGGEDPMMGGGEDPMMGGEMGQEEALQQLISALEELGVPIESLAGAGAPGEKLANAVNTFRRSGKYEIKGAADKRARHIRNLMKDHVREIMGTK